MKRTIPKILAILLMGLAWSLPANAEFTGDKKAACEALLCLMAGERPDECTPPIRRYFSITHRKPHKQLKARKSFLKLCPTGENEIADVVAEGAGRCEPEALLKSLNPEAYYSASRSGGRVTNYRTTGVRTFPRECRAFNELRNVPNPVRRTAYYRSGRFVNGSGRGVQTLYFWEMP